MDQAHSSHRTVWHRIGLVGRRLLLAASGAVAVWLLGLTWYVSAMPQQVDDASSQTDAIVVLTGGSERLHVGLDLLRQGKAPLLFISGVHPETTLDALLAEEPPLPPPLRQKVILGHGAVDTIGNAIETAVWIRAKNLSSVRLVTASYHMPRSLMEFSAALPSVRIVAHPVFPPNVKQDSWWNYRGTAVLFASEYTKYLVARLRLILPDTPQQQLVFSTPQT